MSTEHSAVNSSPSICRGLLYHLSRLEAIPQFTSYPIPSGTFPTPGGKLYLNYFLR